MLLALFMRGRILVLNLQLIEQDENSIIVMEKIRTGDTAEQRTLPCRAAIIIVMEKIRTDVI